MYDHVVFRAFEAVPQAEEMCIRDRYAVERGDEFSVYIIDWLIPDMNGIEIVRQIRKVIGDRKSVV